MSKFEPVCWVVFMSLIFVLLIGMLTCAGWAAYNYCSMLNECRSKGHTRLYCNRAIDGKSIKLDDANLDN